MDFSRRPHAVKFIDTNVLDTSMTLSLSRSSPLTRNPRCHPQQKPPAAMAMARTGLPARLGSKRGLLGCLQTETPLILAILRPSLLSLTPLKHEESQYPSHSATCPLEQVNSTS